MQQVRMLLAIVLSIGAMVIYYTWIAPPLPPAATPAAQTSVTPQAPATAPVEAPSVASSPLLPAAEDQKVEVSNQAVEADFSSSQGFVSSWKLKNYFKQPDKNKEFIDLLEGSPANQALRTTLGNAEFDAHPDFKVREETNEKNQKVLVFSREASGLAVTQRITFADEQSSHFVDVDLSVKNTASEDKNVEPRLWISKNQKIQAQEKGFLAFLKPKDFFQTMTYQGGKLLTRRPQMGVVSDVTESGPVLWTGVADRYFLLSLISRRSEGVSIRHGQFPNNDIFTSLSYGHLVLKPGEEQNLKYSAFMGPKKREELAQLGVSLEKSVNYGWISPIAIPILWLLIFFNKYLGNWGLAIILLTFLIKLLLHPVNKKSMRSMKEMQKVQPLLKQIQEKYKDNREKLNQEMMALFREHKVNPLSGCLPMVLQLPIYIALYNVLWNAVELFHSPFFGPYRDLAAPDPYFIMPIILGGLLALQQRFTPSATNVDPAQQKIMTFMPLMFSAFMIFLPVGLVLYIMVNTLTTVVQQLSIHKDTTVWGLITGKGKKFT